jgi:hypothetical protein
MLREHGRTDARQHGTISHPQTKDYLHVYPEQCAALAEPSLAALAAENEALKQVHCHEFVMLVALWPNAACACMNSAWACDVSGLQFMV